MGVIGETTVTLTDAWLPSFVSRSTVLWQQTGAGWRRGSSRPHVEYVRHSQREGHALFPDAVFLVISPTRDQDIVRVYGREDLTLLVHLFAYSRAPAPLSGRVLRGSCRNDVGVYLCEAVLSPLRIIVFLNMVHVSREGLRRGYTRTYGDT